LAYAQLSKQSTLGNDHQKSFIGKKPRDLIET